MNFFIRNLDTTGFRINYMDTDSIVMSLSKPLDDLVLPHRKAVWARTKSQWFVMDPKCPHQKREPGKSIVFENHLLIINQRSTKGRIQNSKWRGGIFESKV